MTHDETAQKFHALMAQFKRRLEKLEQTRAELCAMGCNFADIAKENGMISDEIHTQVIAPK